MKRGDYMSESYISELYLELDNIMKSISLIHDKECRIDCLRDVGTCDDILCCLCIFNSNNFPATNKLLNRLKERLEND